MKNQAHDHEPVAVSASGHVLIKDDLGDVLLDKVNAIHPQNMARIIARSLANEENSNIFRIALGNGGTTTDAGFNVTLRTPNDGQPPDVRTWNSRLYRETYSEVIDDSSSLLGQDLGSADSSGTRSGGGSDPSTETGAGVISNDLGLSSEVVITAILNANEPSGQTQTSDLNVAAGSFAFDELGLYTSGASASDSIGIVNVDVGNKNSEDDTGLVAGEQYGFRVEVDQSGTFLDVEFTIPETITGPILFGTLVEAINTGDVNWNPAWVGVSPLPTGALIKISDTTADYPSITGSETFGFLQFSSGISGSLSSIVVESTNNTLLNDLFVSLNASILLPVDGSDAGVANNSANPSNEGERLLTHLIFTPILKNDSRELTITYTLTFVVGRTTQ